MATTPHVPPTRAGLLTERRKLWRAVLAEAREALGPHRLSEPDREELAQLVAIAALRRWSTYRQEIGSLRQWIRGIARNEVRAFRRGRGPASEATDDVIDPDSETPEDALSQRDLLDHLLAQIPAEQRRIVTLVEMWGLTLREAATIERTSTTRAHARHKAGMKALREAADRFREEQARRGLVPLPFTMASLFIACRPRHLGDELEEQAWQRASAEIEMDAAPPESGVWPSDPAPANDDPDPPSHRPPRGHQARLLRLLGFLGGALLGPAGVLAGMAIERGRHAPPPLAAPASALPVPVRDDVSNAAAPAPAADASTIPTTNAASPRAAPRVREPTAWPRDGEDDSLRAERVLVDRARAALEAGDPTSAIAALAEHARRFPAGQNAGARERLRMVACTEAEGDRRTPQLDDWCAGRR
ncbi:MAG: sigma-70 family RNA polymerase sigma factor [Minicystis sp.]